MRTSILSWLVSGTVVLGLGISGCSKSTDSKSNTGPTSPVQPARPTYQLSSYLDLVQRATPPQYQGAEARNQSFLRADSVSGDIWKDGSNPILGKVFGTDETFSLYHNLGYIDFLTSTINRVASQGVANGDTIVAPTPEGVSIHAIVSFYRLTDPVAVPAACRPVLGLDQVALDYVFTARVLEAPMVIHMGFARTDSAETLLIWQHEMTQGSATSILYAHRDIAHDTVRIRSMFYKAWDTSLAKWNFDIYTSGSDLFVYRMGWFADEPGNGQQIAGVVGGGNHATQFALRFRAHSTGLDQDITQVFGDSYAEIEGSVPDGLQSYTGAPEYAGDSMLTGQLDTPFSVGE